MHDVLVGGVGMTNFGSHEGVSTRELAASAAAMALADAGLSGSDVGFIAMSNAAEGFLSGQEMILGQLALVESDLAGTALVNVENACASGASAFHLAWMAVASGLHKVALAIGAEKMCYPDKRAFGALARGTDIEQLIATRGDDVLRTGAGPFIMEVYAEEAAGYLARSGAPASLYAEVAAKTRGNGSLNPKAHHRQACTPEEVLASPTIAPPLTLLMCSPISDGAAAVLVCSADMARAAAHPPVRVLGTAISSARRAGVDDLVGRAADAAFAQAGIGRDEIDLVEVHDAAAPAEPVALEQLGLVGENEAWKLILDGGTRLDGRIPVNPSGGLLSRGHPLGATGCAQIVELTEQLRGIGGDRQVHGAEVAMAENAGGVVSTSPPAAAACVVTILTNREP